MQNTEADHQRCTVTVRDSTVMRATPGELISCRVATLASSRASQITTRIKSGISPIHMGMLGSPTEVTTFCTSEYKCMNLALEQAPQGSSHSTKPAGVPESFGQCSQTYDFIFG